MSVLNIKELKETIIILQNFMEEMTAQERIDLISCIMEKYCLSCGDYTNNQHCYCENDE